MACYRTNTGTECNTFIINVVLIFTINHIRSDLHTRISCRTRECAHSHCNQNWYKSYISTWVYPVLSIRRKLINVKDFFQPNRVLIDKSSAVWVVVHEEVIMQPRLTVDILVLQLERLVFCVQMLRYRVKYFSIFNYISITG